MSEIVGSIWWLIVALGVLVTFHEFGHYWVARRCGVKVLRFSVGFGKPIWSRTDKHGTEFAVAPIPLGGYVSMLDEAEGEVAPELQSQAFNRKSIGQRMAVVVAGPVANLILCVVLLWVMFVVGRQDYSATIGATQGMATEQGLRAGDRIESIDGENTRTAGDALQLLSETAMDRRDAQLTVIDQNGMEHKRTLRLSKLPTDFNQENIGGVLGLVWQFQLVPARVESTKPDSPASKILLPGDEITALNGDPVHHFADLYSLVQKLGKEGGEALIEVDRKGERLALYIQPQLAKDNAGKDLWALGIIPPTQSAPYDAVQQFGPLQAIPAAFRKTYDLAGSTLGMIRRLLTGHASVKTISGPVTIAQVANVTAERGVDWFLYFLALMSMSLAIMNLLPIPFLDGGRLLYYLIELVKGSPLSEKAAATGQYLGLAMLAGLMGLAFYNDIVRLLN